MSDIHLYEGFYPGAPPCRIYYRFYQRHQRSYAPTILIVHGLGEHSGRYQELIQHLLKLGLQVACPDLRGHGLSSGTRGHTWKFAHYYEDILRLQKRLSLYRPILLGHSMGGLIALRFAQLYPEHCRALVLSSPLLGVAVEVPPLKQIFAKIAFHLLPTLRLANEIDPQHLSHDLEKVRQYQNDPLVHAWVTPRWFGEMQAQLALAHRNAQKLRLPLLLQLAGDDRICDPAQAENFFHHCASSPKTILRYPGLFHEIYNELERKQVFLDLAQWLKNTLKIP
ncbi:MAG: alpha/beta hydrolase [Planctomycetota bacterium]|nr:MAG: alpha/beta hydrolase [Planctomycetota bacterium]